MTNRIRFGILGYGLHAQYRLLPSFARCEASEFAGLYRRDPAKAAESAKQAGVPAFASAAALCASPEIDAVFITSPDAVHLEDAEIAFAHGKAVLCEKPLTATTAQAEAMLAAASKAGVLFGVAHHYRWARSVNEMRTRIAAGEIGEVRTAHAEFNYAAQNSRRTWITDPTLAAGGPIGDVGVHCIDTLRYMLGADVQSVATLATQDERSGPVEASANLQLEMTANIIASVSVSARAAYRTVLEVVGSEGTLLAENGMTVDWPVDVTLRRGGELVDLRRFNNADAYALMMDNFARAMRGSDQEEPFAGPGAEGVRNQHILDAAFRSWRSGQREPVV